MVECYARKNLLSILLAVVWVLTFTLLGVFNLRVTEFTQSQRSLLDDDTTTAIITPHLISTTIGQCDTIHIAIPIVKRTADALVLLKSLLLYRDSPLHIHFIVSKDFVQEATTKLMVSWRLPQVNYTVHNVAKRFGQAHSITKFSSDVKLFVTSILPDNVDKVIYIDTYFLLTANIKELWKQFFRIENINIPYGAVRSLSNDTFCAAKPSVILFNLKVMRKLGWNTNSSDYNWESMNHTRLCNVSKTFTNFNIPCSWNVNLDNEKFTHGLECNNTTIANSKALDSSGNSFQNLQYLIKLKKFIVQYDGSLLSFSVIDCGTKLHSNHLIKKDKNEEVTLNALRGKEVKTICKFLKNQSKQVFRTLLHYYGEPRMPKDSHETTLVTQLSLDRLQAFSALISQWDGPMSIAMYGSDSDVLIFSEFVSLFELLSERRNVNVHIVYKQGKLYPTNYLRNTALNAVKTQYVFLNDGDFLPMKGLFSYLKRATKIKLDDEENRKTVLIVPAFETQRMELNVPKSKEELLKEVKHGLVKPLCDQCPHNSHKPTNYKKWYETEHSYEVEWKNYYEPYIVVRSDVARYDERFIGYGFNKVSQLTQLKAQCYRFLVLADVFVIHVAHQRSMDKKFWSYRSFRICRNIVYEQFLTEIQKKYGKKCLNSVTRIGVR